MLARGLARHAAKRDVEEDVGIPVAMLVLRGCPDEQRVTVGDLARQLLIKHNSAVGLVDRLVGEELAVREQSTSDRRKVELRLTRRGREVLARLAAMHRHELQRIGPLLSRFFAQLSRLEGAGQLQAPGTGRLQARQRRPAARKVSSVGAPRR